MTSFPFVNSGSFKRFVEISISYIFVPFKKNIFLRKSDYFYLKDVIF